ncbi:methyl-accepting chemotaxis protein [Salinicola lusitanus]|uniref:methyl-accepting chemotaxis protein n=1 Tax=Salinicola lusitanus TaxID=1949085 RepID=UPI000DA1B97B|nr:methyl-accepting chemotaxis protein [Salinicola lusitanus]
MLTNFRQIRIKYTLAFLLIPLALMIVYLADYRLIESLKSRMQEFGGTFNAAIGDVLNGDRDLYQSRVAELEFLRSTPGSERARQALDAHSENARQAWDRITNFRTLMADYPEVVATTAGVDDKYRNWLDASRKTFDLHANGDTAAARDQLEGDSLTAFEELRLIYDLAGQRAFELIPELESAALSRADTQETAIIGFGIVVLVLSVSLALGGPLLMSRALRQITARIREISEGDGDLTARIASRRRDEIGDLATQFDNFIARIDKLLQGVRNSTASVSVAADEIAHSSDDLASRTEQSASNLQQTSASMEQISATVKNTADSAQQASRLTQDTVDNARAGQNTMQAVIATMGDIRDSSNRISEIIAMIDSIAFQTNILALNASVEAARAGEHGRGFAVVAQEVRVLASRSSEASNEIRTLIDTSVAHARSGAELVDRAGSAMQDIVKSVQHVNDVINEISAGTKEQSIGIGQVNTAVSDLDSMTQHNASMVEQSRAAAAEMRDQVLRLDELLSGFKLSQTAPPAKSSAPTTPATPNRHAITTAPKASRALEWESF